MKSKIAIIYYSATGTTYELARAIEEGAREAGAEVRFRKVKELAPQEAINSNEGWSAHAKKTQNVPIATQDDLEWADGVIFGTPTRYGLPTAQLKQFLDQTGPLWSKGKLANKIISSFTSAATKHGGHETTITALNNTFYHWGSIIVGLGYVEESQFEAGNPYGASFVSNNGQLDPDETALVAARLQGKRVTEITTQFLVGAEMGVENR
ncbi:NAD(P)H:quinone oxidoreductase [soil metagenome]